MMSRVLFEYFGAQKKAAVRYNFIADEKALCETWNQRVASSNLAGCTKKIGGFAGLRAKPFLYQMLFRMRF